MAGVPAVHLNNGLLMPKFGLGTWQSKPGEVEEAVKVAIDAGYRHIDCALAYQNEVEVGSAIRQKIQDGTVKREELFVVSKLWNNFHKPSSVAPQCKKTLENFGLDYIDLYLIHWPFAFQETDPIDYFPRDATGKLLLADDDYVDTWKAMENCVRDGLTRSIGLSNFNTQQIGRILESASIKPVTNQVECHPYLNQKKLTAWCNERGIIITAYSPLGSPRRPWVQPGDPNLLDDPRILAIAQKLNRTPSQVVLNYLLSLSVVPIPKSVNSQRIKDNIKVFDFKINSEDLTTLDNLNCNGRLCVFNEEKELEELKRKRNCERQRAYYQRHKDLKKKYTLINSC